MSLTPKQRLFVEYYLQSWNARESAERAGYGSPQKTGYRLLHNPGVVGVINERLTEIGLSTNEIIARMAQYARNNPAQFFVFGDVPAKDVNGKPLLDSSGQPIFRREMLDIDWAVFERYGYLVKKLSYDRKGRPVIEFYDAQRALETLGKYANLDAELSKTDGQTVEDLSVIADLIADAKERGGDKA